MAERSFGRMIKSRRTELGLSQAKLGELVGRSATTIRSWERDATQPTDATVITALAAILGVEEGALYEAAGAHQPEVETSPTIEQALASLRPDTDETGERIKEPDPEEPSADPVVDIPTSPEPSYSLPASQETYVVTPATPPMVEPSYMEDPSQRRLYQTRTIATIAILVGLGIAFIWALSEGLGSLGAWWDDFFGNLRL